MVKIKLKNMFVQMLMWTTEVSNQVVTLNGNSFNSGNSNRNRKCKVVSMLIISRKDMFKGLIKRGIGSLFLLILIIEIDINNIMNDSTSMST